MNCDIAIVGAGAAGLAAAIAAAETAKPGTRIALLDGAKKIGTKILISGGGRCNITNARVTPDDFKGGSKPLIRRVLKSFDERRTLAWFESLGLTFKTEKGGKVFPTSNRAWDVLDALGQRVDALGVDLITGARVTAISRDEDGFTLTTEDTTHTARRLIMATGGLSVAKSGSDGWGIAAVRRLGHTIVPTTPALVPLLLQKSSDLSGRFAEFRGITLDVRLTLFNANQKRLNEQTGSLLFTHFGLSGPVVLDISRHLLRAQLERPDEKFTLTLGLPQFPTPQEADAWLLEQANTHPKNTVASALREHMPDRLALAFTEGMDLLCEMSRDQRRTLARNLSQMSLPVIGDRGYRFAEVTAGGVDLREVDVRTMESRVVPGLHLCGEILDVDGRIGGFNFQWAWASGHLAGQGAAHS